MASANFKDLLKAAEDAGYSNCPPGVYDVRVAAVETKLTAKGKDMFVIKFEIANGPNAGRKVFNRITISPENSTALGFFFREMKAMGADSAFFATDPSVQAVAAKILNALCRIEVGTQMYNNEEREDVKKVLPPLGGPVSAPPVVPSVAAPVPVAAPIPVVTTVKVADAAAPSLPY